MKMREILIIIAVVLIIIFNIATSFNDHSYVVTVNDKDRVYNAANDTSYYLIYCKDDAGNYYEFQNSDDLFRLKFRSSTVYNQIEVGHKYKFTVVGYRIGFFSAYENIIKFEKIE